MIQIIHSLNEWPSFITNQNILNRLCCSQCEGQCNINMRNISLAKLFFVEFSVELMTILPFSQLIIMNDTEYVLVGLVRHLSSHFTCAVFQSNNVWLYIDDLNEQCYFFESFNQMQQEFMGGWFFGVYIKRTDKLQDNYGDFTINNSNMSSTVNCKIL